MAGEGDWQPVLVHLLTWRGAWRNEGHLAYGALDQCKPDQAVRGPEAAWGVAGMSGGQRAPSALLAVVRLAASESNKTKQKVTWTASP